MYRHPSYSFNDKSCLALVYLFALIAGFFSPFAFASELSYDLIGKPLTKVHYPEAHGGHNQNWTSIQSSSQHIYVGHTNGVSRWDGERWENLDTPQSTPVRSIVEWRNEIYFGTKNDLVHLQIDDTGQMHYVSLLQSTTFQPSDFGEIWSAAANSDGVLFNAVEKTFFFDGTAVYQLNEVIASKHASFEIKNEFLYKPRHLANLYSLRVVKNEDNLQFLSTELPILLPSNARVMEIMPYKEDGLVIVTEQHGIFTYIDNELKTVDATKHLVENVQLYDAIKSTDELYYVSTTHRGMYIIDQDFKILRHLTEDDNIEMNSVFSVNEDHQGNIWLTGIPNVVKMLPPHVSSEFKVGTRSTEILSLQNTEFGIIASGNGTYKLQSQARSFSPPKFELMHPDLNNSVDFATFQNSIIKPGWGGIYELTLDEGANFAVETNQLSTSGLARVIKRANKEGSFFVSASNGVFYIEKAPNNNDWTVFKFPLINEQIVSLEVDSKGTIWLGSDIARLLVIENAAEAAKRLMNNDSAEAKQEWRGIVKEIDRSDGLGLGPVALFSVDNNIVLSSAGQLFELNNNKLQKAQHPIFEHQAFNSANNIDRLFVYAKNKLINQSIWYRVDGNNGFFELNDEGVWEHNTYPFAGLPDGGLESMFLTDEGVAWLVRDKAEIYRIDLDRASKIPPVGTINLRLMSQDLQALAFEEIAQNDVDESVNYANKDYQVSKSLEATQSSLRVSFSASSNAGVEASLYRTRLLESDASRVDDAWSEWSREVYRDLNLQAYGDFTFEVQVLDPWNRIIQANLRLTRTKPWYISKLAIACYILVLVLLTLSIAWLIQKWRTKALIADNIALEEKVLQRTKEVNEKVEELRQQQILKDRFFSNVSHEFRTPLTLTIGPLELLLNEHPKELSQSAKQLANTALGNASKMLALVGQVLDLNRLEAGKLPLRISNNDIAELLRNITNRFDAWAKQHDQTISLIDCEEPLLGWFDLDQIEKCVSNLLSNAIKYSGNGSNIEIRLAQDATNIIVDVIDDGKGIAKDSKGKIFDRFYQAPDSERLSTPGTGIGLSMVKDIMSLHYGSVELIDMANTGCHFQMRFVKGRAHYKAEQILEPVHSVVLPESRESLLMENWDDESKGFGKDNDITTLLLVDDNQELRNFISLRLSTNYRILQAENGEEGLLLAKNSLPDLIISDVSMPKMDGFALTKALKNDITTQTIPLILLTAKATKREVVEGFSVGADDYLTKPFDTSELIVRVNAQIQARKLIRQSMLDEISGVNSAKLSFTDKFESIVQHKLSDPEFSVESLAEALFMSRDTLIRRCKKEFNSTPSKLINEAKMNKAKTLLSQRQLSISEIAYACGYESLAYFSNSFKKKFASSPTEFLVER